MRYEAWEVCPKCGQRTMPTISPESKATAAACQNCGYIKEKENDNRSN